jgi:hypothetical protein
MPGGTDPTVLLQNLEIVRRRIGTLNRRDPTTAMTL